MSYMMQAVLSDFAQVWLQFEVSEPDPGTVARHHERD